MIMSTGAATLDDVRRAYDAMHPINPHVAFLQCTAAYPPEYEQLDLRVIETYRNEFPDVVVGFSGHDSGIAMATAAYTLGARIVEKHFTLNRALRGTDHAFSLEPAGLRKLVRDLERTRGGPRRRRQAVLRDRARPGAEDGQEARRRAATCPPATSSPPTTSR